MRDRTADLLNAIQALSQLSYTPICNGLSAFPSALRQPILYAKGPALSSIFLLFFLFSRYFIPYLTPAPRSPHSLIGEEVQPWQDNVPAACW